MWRDLFWANSLEESLHIVVMGEENWISLSVVWVLVSVCHLGNFARVVVTSIFLHVLGLGTIYKMKIS